MFDQMQLINPQSMAAKGNQTVKFAVDLSNRATDNAARKPLSPHIKDLENTLSNIFPTTREENNLQRARRMLGDIAASLSDSELETFLTEFEYLLDSWMDEFEKKIFDNKTLIQLLKEG